MRRYYLPGRTSPAPGRIIFDRVVPCLLLMLTAGRLGTSGLRSYTLHTIFEQVVGDLKDIIGP